MGTYLGVKAVEARGKMLTGHLPEKQPSIPAGKRLIAIPENGVYKIAGDVTDPREYDAMYRSYAAGAWIRGTLYLLDDNLVAQCPDEGRVRII